MPRLLKQIVIAAIFFILAGSIVYFYFIKDIAEPIPTPAVSVPPPLVVSKHLLKVGDFDYDFLAEIRNPNTDFGAAAVSYELNLFGQVNELVTAKKGLVSLLPGQTRHEIISPIAVDKEVFKAEFKVRYVAWERLKGFVPQNLFSVKNQEYARLTPGQGFSRLRATLFNDSNFDFNRVDVHIVLFGENGEVLAVNKTDIRTFLAKTARFIEVKWPKPFEGRVGRVEINAYTDVFKNENFLREHGTQEKFQKFY